MAGIAIHTQQGSPTENISYGHSVEQETCIANRAELAVKLEELASEKDVVGGAHAGEKHVSVNLETEMVGKIELTTGMEDRNIGLVGVGVGKVKGMKNRGRGRGC